MLTLQGLRMKTEYMMEEIRQRAVAASLEKLRTALRRYYETCEGGDECTRLIRELEDDLGVDPEEIFEIDWQIREQVLSEQREEAIP